MSVNVEEGPLTGARRYEQLDAHIGQGTYGKVEKARDLIDGEYVSRLYIPVFLLTL